MSLPCRTQAVFSIATVILFVADSYYWESSYVDLSMKLEVSDAIWLITAKDIPACSTSERRYCLCVHVAPKKLLICYATV